VTLVAGAVKLAEERPGHLDERHGRNAFYDSIPQAITTCIFPGTGFYLRIIQAGPGRLVHVRAQ